MKNLTILIGRCGQDPEVINLASGRSLVKLSLATSETWKDASGNKQEDTQWHHLIFWEPLSKVVDNFVKKGDLIYVEGKLQTRSWDDKDGNKRYVTEIVGQKLTLLGGSKQVF